MIDALDTDTQPLPFDDAPESSGMTDDELLAALRDELDNAETEDSDADRVEALDYYWGRLPAPKPGIRGRSKVVSTDVMDAVEATMAEIMPAIGSQQLAQFPPMGPEDEQQADQESRVVNHVVMGVGGGFTAFTQAIKDGLLRRNALIKVFWDEHTDVIYETHKDVQLQQVPQLLTPRSQDERVELAAADYEEEVYQSEFGPQAAISSGSITIKRTRKVRRPRLQAVPVDEVLVNVDHPGLNYDEARFIAHQRVVSASELVAMGIDREIVDDLPEFSMSTKSAQAARQRSGAEREYETGHKSTKPILLTEAYYRIDRDGDGIAELRRILCAGDDSSTLRLLEDEPWDVQPFAVGSPYIVPFSWEGLSLYDRLRFVQDVKTDLVRQTLDAGTRNLNQRLGVIERQVNYNDMATSVMGGMVRMQAAGAVFPLPDVQLPQSAFALLEMMDKMRREKGGAAIDTAGQAQQVAHDTAHGLERTMTAIEQVNAMVARNLAETLIKGVYSKMHRLLKKHWPGVIQTRTGGQWLQQVPQTWPERDEVAVQVGMTTGERMRNMQLLGQIIQQQLQALQMGQDGVLVSLPQLYNTLIDFARAGGLQAPEQYWIDPASPQSQQAAQQKAQQAQQQAAAQQQAMEAQANLMKEVEQIRAQGGVQRATIEAQRAIAQTQINARVQMEKQDADVEAKFADMRLKLVELNAKYDAEPVPDTMAQIEETNDRAAVESAMRGREAGEEAVEEMAEGPDTEDMT
jgi:hypothetical protein